VVVSVLQLEPGQVIAGRYRLVRQIGQGGMGQVFEAVQINLERPVALKLLRPGPGDLRDARARFEREARVAAALHHPGAVAIHDFGEHEGHLFLAMELLEGASVRELLRHGPPPLRTAVEVGLEVTAVLVAAHEIGLVHRDLKPENIFVVERDGQAARVVVADFGLAFIRDREGADRLTREGLVTGTPAYLSPEQAQGRTLGPEADVYSLGCTLYELLAGEVPFAGSGELDVLNQHLFGTPRPIRSVRPVDLEPVPQRLEDLVCRMLAKRAPNRPSAAEAHAELESTLAELGMSERGRGERLRLAREIRGIDASHLDSPTLAARDAPSSADAGQCQVLAVVGEIPDDLRLALLASGWQPTQCSPDHLPAGAIAAYAPGAGVETLARIGAVGLPLVTDTEASNIRRISDLLATGVDEVVPCPVGAEQLCRRLARATKRGRRRSAPR
jgi:serine/threonine protein kinase